MPRFEKGVLVVNAEAGQSTAGHLLSLVVPALSRECRKLEIIQASSEEEFRTACIETAQEDILFLLGGDGTLHTAIQMLKEKDRMPVVGLLPGGTCNDFARTLGIPLSLSDAAEALVHGNVSEIDAAKINGHIFMNFAGIGLIAEASENIDPDLKARYGKLSYYFSAWQALKNSEPFKISLVIDGTHYTEEAVLMLVMNGNSIGTHRFPLETIDPSDGLLDIFLIQSSSINAIREWFSLSQTSPLTLDLVDVAHYNGTEVQIHTEEGKKVDTDGELYLTTPVSIEILPKAVRFLTP